MKSNACAIIPAYNEQQSIGWVISQVRSVGHIDRVIVVDDGSRDATAREARRYGATVLVQSRNTGTGYAVERGLRYANRHGYAPVVLLDGDGQHDPRFIPELVKGIGDGELVIGSRYVPGGRQEDADLLRRIGTGILSAWFYVLYGRTVRDPTSGFRVLGGHALRFLAQSYPKQFSEPEVLLLMWRHAIREVPVVMQRRRFGKSSITTIRGMVLMGYMIGKMLYDRLFLR